MPAVVRYTCNGILPSNVSSRGRCVTRVLAFFKNRTYIYECLLSKRTHGEMEVFSSLSLVTNGCPWWRK